MAQLIVDTQNTVNCIRGSTEGTLIGRNATTPVGFFGAVPVVQPTVTIAGVSAATLLTALMSLNLVKGV